MYEEFLQNNEKGQVDRKQINRYGQTIQRTANKYDKNTQLH